MTLHWWMHWFWVTAQIVVSLTSPTTHRSPEQISDSTTTPFPLISTSTLPPPSPSPDSAMRLQYTETTESLAGRLQQSYRIAKAIGIQPTELLPLAASAEPQSLRLVTTPASPPSLRSTALPGDNKTAFEVSENKTTQPGRIPGKKESKITWVHAFTKPPKAKFEDKTSSTTASNVDVDDMLTVMPLQEEIKPDPNAIRRDQALLQQEQQQLRVASSSPGNGNRTATGELLLGEETGEPHAIATAASVLDANVGDSTRLGRARGTFTSEFQRDQLSREEQQHRTENKEETIKENAASSENVTEIATITGSCLAIIVLLSTVGSLGFIMYRRRYLNPPQTLNSDKCSNPDSSGYIDDSTIRDNSEEMYSLDNDSFLNSLEAMTIQNYWTDSVKHTKL